MPGVVVQSRLPRQSVRGSDRPGPEPSWSAGVGAAFRTTIDVQDIPQAQRLADAYAPVEDALVDMGFERRRLRPTVAQPDAVMAYSMGAAPKTIDPVNGDAIWGAIGEARRRDPRAFADLPANRGEFEKQVLSRYGARQRDQWAASRAGLSAQLVGGAGASFADPVNILTVPYGGGKTIAQTVLREAVVNAATEAGQQPVLARNMGRVGEALTGEQMALNVGTAAVAGGALGGLMKGTGTYVIPPVVEAAIPHLPAPVQAWLFRRAQGQTPDGQMVDLADAFVGRQNMSADERAAAIVMAREAAIARANPFEPNGAGTAFHAQQLAAAVTRALDNVPPARAQALGGSSLSPVTPRRDGAFVDQVFASLVRQESGGRRGVAGPMTEWGQAHGLTQVLDGTAEALAKRLGLPWRPELMRGASDEAAAYQLRIGRAYFDEGLARFGGDVRQALHFYHGGPNQRRWGAKTRAYADQVLARAGGGEVRIAEGVLDGPETVRVQAELDRLRAERTETERPGEGGLDAADYVDRYLAGEGRGDGPDDLRVQQYAANSATAIEAEFARRAATSPEPLPDADLMPSRDVDPAAIDAAIRGYVDARAGSLQPDVVAKKLGLEVDDAEASLSRLAADPAVPIRATRYQPEVPRRGARPGRPEKPVRYIREPISRGPKDLKRFLAELGGVADNEGHDLIKGRGLRGYAPGAGAVVRRDGALSLDRARELAAEAGYFHDRSPEEAMSETTTADFLELLEEAHSSPRYALADLDAIDAREAAREMAAELAELGQRIDAQLVEQGFAFDRNQRARAARAMREDGLVADDAISRVLGEDLDDALLADRINWYERYDVDWDQPGPARGAEGETGRGDVPGARDPLDDGTRGSERGGVDSLPPTDQASLKAFDDPDGLAAREAVDSLDHDLRMLLDRGGEVDPNIAARQRQEAAARAASPLRSAADQDSAIGLGLFDVADQPLLRLEEGGPELTLREMMQRFDDDAAAIDTVKKCL